MTTSGELHLGLVGWPLGHSLSPVMHQRALRACGLKGDYTLFPVPPGAEAAEQLKQLTVRVRQGALQGLNVTIPHKQAFLPLVDELSPVARAAGAVNTICRRDSVVMGDNSDVPGFLADLRRAAADLFNAEIHQAALVLGAGGAARGVVCALAQAGWQVTVAARRERQAEELVRALGSPGGQTLAGRLSAIALEDSAIEKLPSMIKLVVNASSAGMYPQVGQSPWPAGLGFPPGAVVYDTVYNPAETALVRAARAAGLVAVSGLGMLVEQAALAFELWTSLPAPRDEMLLAAQEALKTGW